MSRVTASELQTNASSSIKNPALNHRSITIGRDENVDLILVAPTISRYHATLEPNKRGYYVLYDHSTNGAFVDGKRVVGYTKLSRRDRIQVGPFTLELQGDLLQVVDGGDRIRLSANELVIQHRGKRRLDNISLVIEPGQLVALVGGSGGYSKDLVDEENLLFDGSLGNSQNLSFPYHVHNFISPDNAPCCIKGAKSHPRFN